MVDRLSTLQTFQLGVSTILERQAELQETQLQVATGKKILTPADDPSGTVRALNVEEDLAIIDQYGRNASLAQGQLSLTETALTEVQTSLSRVRELAVQANNSPLSPENRQAIADELNQRLDELVDLANTRVGNDEYLFAGFQNTTRPFSRSGSTVTYNGDDGQRFLEIAPGSQVAVRDPGSRVFLAARAGNGDFDFRAGANSGTAVVKDSRAESGYVRDNYTVRFIQAVPTDPVTYEVTDGAAAVVATGTYVSGDAITFNGVTLVIEGEPANNDEIIVDGAPRQSIFTTVAELANALEADNGSPASDAAVANAVASGLNNLDQALGQVLEVRTDVGARLSRIETQEVVNQEFELALREILSDVEDLDLAEAISRLNLQLVALQAAQQTFVNTQGLNLFDYL